MNDQHFADGAFVRVLNRTSKELTATYNGRSVTIPPRGKGARFMTPFAAEKACQQNRLMGSEDPLDPRSFESLLYVEGTNMPSDPIEQSDKIEALDRSMLDPQLQVVRQINVRQPMTPRDNTPTEGAHFTGSPTTT